MAAQNSDHDKARELAEKALDKLVEGDEAALDALGLTLQTDGRLHGTLTADAGTFSLRVEARAAATSP